MMVNLKKKRLIRNISAYGSFTLCLVGDSAIGWQLWWGNEWWPLLLHVPLVLLGIGGLSLYRQPDDQISESAQQVERNRWTLSNKDMQRVSGWSIVAFLFGLYAFPGFGLLAYSVALLITNILPKQMPVESRDLSASWPALVAVPKPEVQPLVESVYDTNLDTRRAAVAALGRQASPPAVQLLRQLLSDPQPEIRSDASIALSNLDDTFAHALEEALAEWRTAPAEGGPSWLMSVCLLKVPIPTSQVESLVGSNH
jgi:hypothetical protein